ncbi:MAG: energy transducer TonB [Bacteroidales bacterium]|nr:energy transducer TonB [Bacteroidales bacterium]
MLNRILFVTILIISLKEGYSQESSMIKDTICNDIYELYMVNQDNPSLKHGKFERYYKENIIELGEYKDGKKEGAWTLLNGKNFRSTGQYINGRKEGDWALIKGRDTVAVITFNEDKATEVYTPHDKKRRKASSKSIDENTIKTLDVMPVFEGGNYDKYRAYINNNIIFPKVEKKSPAEGTIYVEFIVNEIGQTEEVKILHGILDEYDWEAKKIIINSPPWIPGIKDGEPVKVKFIFPIVFKL